MKRRTRIFSMMVSLLMLLFVFTGCEQQQGETPIDAHHELSEYGFETMFDMFETNYWIPIIDYNLDEGWVLADSNSMYGYIWEEKSFKYTWMTVYRGQDGKEGDLSPDDTARSDLYIVKSNDCISYSNGNNTLTITDRVVYNGCMVIEVDRYSSLASEEYKHNIEMFIISKNIDWDHSPELIKYGGGYLKYYFSTNKYF